MLVSGALAIGLISFLILVGTIIANNQRAQKQAAQWADTLAQATNPDGTYLRWQGESIDTHSEKPRTLFESDPWGQHFVVRYHESSYIEELVVQSSGRDRIMDTNDDIVVVRRNIKKAALAAAAQAGVENTAASLGHGAIRGAIEAAKESLTKKK